MTLPYIRSSQVLIRAEFQDLIMLLLKRIGCGREQKDLHVFTDYDEITQSRQSF